MRNAFRFLSSLRRARSRSNYLHSHRNRRSIERLERRDVLSAVPAGIEFRVNTTTTDNQDLPQVAMDADGDFVMVWSSNNQDGDRGGIFGQLYDRAGDARGGEFQVNEY